jgi:glycosyltransferase involved in cell wall biosynthesis
LIQKTEAEIMKNWQGNISKPVVSICCITYNHEQFIEDALDSFLMQETDFPFEIVVDDDCSTDKTADIIRKYKMKFPNIINDNLRKKNIGAVNNFIANMKRANGKYIALCEGDDYWIDPLKLQKQVDIFILNPDITLCFHPAIEINHSSSQSNIICKHFDKDTEVPIKNIILGRGGYMPTVSLVFKNLQQELMSKLYEDAPIGDYFIQVYMASIGTTFYINNPMGVYRRNTIGSWTESQNSLNNRITYNKQMVIALDDFSKYMTQHRKLIYEVMIYYTKNNLQHIKIIPNKIVFLINISSKITNYNKIIFFLRLLKQIAIG